VLSGLWLEAVSIKLKEPWQKRRKFQHLKRNSDDWLEGNTSILNFRAGREGGAHCSVLGVVGLYTAGSVNGPLSRRNITPVKQARISKTTNC
jgi:hypothetical protein